METTITLNASAENDFEFALEIQGADAKTLVVRFILVCDEMMLMFPCVANEKGWMVKIPPIAKFEIAPKTYLIEGLLDGHYFNIMNGNVECTESPENAKIEATPPKKVGGEEKKEEKEEKKGEPQPPKEEPKKKKTTEEKQIDEIISRIASSSRTEVIEKQTKKDSLIKSILAERKN